MQTILGIPLAPDAFEAELSANPALKQKRDDLLSGLKASGGVLVSTSLFACKAYYLDEHDAVHEIRYPDFEEKGVECGEEGLTYSAYTSRLWSVLGDKQSLFWMFNQVGLKVPAALKLPQYEEGENYRAQAEAVLTTLTSPAMQEMFAAANPDGKLIGAGSYHTCAGRFAS